MATKKQPLTPIEEALRQIMQEILTDNKGNITKAAVQGGVSRTTFKKYIKLWKLK